MKRLFNALMFGVSAFTLGVYTFETLGTNYYVPPYKWFFVTFFGIMWLRWTVKESNK